MVRFNRIAAWRGIAVPNGSRAKTGSRPGTTSTHGRRTRRSAFVLAALAGWLSVAAPALRAAEDGDAVAMRCLKLRDTRATEAITLAESTLQRDDLPIEAEIKLRVCLGGAAALLGDKTRTIEAAERIDAALDAHPMPPEFSLRALSNVGAMLHTIGRIGPALDFYQRALETARKQDEVAAQVSTLVNIAIIYSDELGAYEKAEDVYARAQALDDSGRAADEPHSTTLAYNRGQNLLRMRRWQAALEQFEAAGARASAQGKDLLRRRAEAERIALLARRAPSSGGAIEALRRLANEQRQQSDLAGAVLTLTRASSVALDHGDTASALREADAAHDLLGDGELPSERRGMLEARVAAYKALGQWKEALADTESLYELELSRLRDASLDNLAELQTKLQDLRHLRELEALRADREKEMQALARSRRLRDIALLALVVLAASSGVFFLYERKTKRRLQRLSTTDTLTSLLNRRAAQQALDAAPRTPEQRLAVFLVDVDHFKEYNDRHGHDAGDAILIDIAMCLRASCRATDVVARWGGEEFLIACPGLDLPRAAELAETLRRAVAESHAAIAEPDHALPSLSIGFSCAPFLVDVAATNDWSVALKLADHALYAAKRSGRDGWVGIWGGRAGELPVAELLAAPERFQSSRAITIVASREPVRWHETDPR